MSVIILKWDEMYDACMSWVGRCGCGIVGICDGRDKGEVVGFVVG